MIFQGTNGENTFAELEKKGLVKYKRGGNSGTIQDLVEKNFFSATRFIISRGQV